MTTKPAPSMMTSLITKRPRPPRQGKPWFASPRAGTQLSGVVMRKESVTRDMIAIRKPPKAAISGRHGCAPRGALRVKRR